MAKANMRRDEDRDVQDSNSGQWGDPTDEPVIEVSFEELMELQDEIEGDDSLGDMINTADTDGSTQNVQMAMDQGLVYTPPTDPPVVPSDDLQGAEIAAGFASSIEDEVEVEQLPVSVDNNDSDAEEDIRQALQYNSETSHIDNIVVNVLDGVAYLRGTVLDDEDSSLVEDFVTDLDIVDEVYNEIEVIEPE